MHLLTMHPLAVKPAGAYRPPGARGSSTPTIFKREDEGGDPYSPSRNGSQTNLAQRGPPSRTSSPLPPKTNGTNGATSQRGPGLRGRVVPGAPPPSEPEEKKQPKRERKKKDDGVDGGQGASAAGTSGESRRKKGGAGAAAPEGVTRKAAIAAGQGERSVPMALDLNGAKALPIDPEPATGTPGIPQTPGNGEGLDPAQKKIRNLNKKVSTVGGAVVTSPRF